MQRAILAGLLTVLAATAVRGTERAAESELMLQKQIVERGITDARLLSVMRRVPRHRFVPADLQAYAYADRPLPIGEGQTISQPYIVAFMTDAAKLTHRAKALEIGTGSGYQAAILAELCHQVFTIEIIPELSQRAAKLLHELGYTNVFLRTGDGYHGWPEEAPFDVILVTAAAPAVPPALFAQLKEGGRMIIPIGEEAGAQELFLVTKRHGRESRRPLLPVRFVPFTRTP